MIGKRMRIAALAATVLSLGLTGCANRLNAEVEAAKAKAEAAKAEADAARAKAEAFKAEIEAANAKAQAEAAAAQAKAAVELPKKIGSDALARVRNRGQEILDTAFPYAIGAVPFKYANLEGVGSVGDGYQATVKLYYTNILHDNYFMEVLVSYDTSGGFRSWRIGQCNDRFAPNVRDLIFR